MAKYLHYFVRQRGIKHEGLCDSRGCRSDMTTKKVEEVTCPRCLRIIEKKGKEDGRRGNG